MLGNAFVDFIQTLRRLLDQELFAPMPSMSESPRYASLSSMEVQHATSAPFATSDGSYRGTGTDFGMMQNSAFELKPALGRSTVFSFTPNNTLQILQVCVCVEKESGLHCFEFDHIPV